MFNPLSLMAKAKRGEFTLDELIEVLSLAGIDAEFAPVPQGEALPAFQGLAGAASLPDASLVRLNLQMKGQQFKGLLVLTQVN